MTFKNTNNYYADNFKTEVNEKAEYKYYGREKLLFSTKKRP